MEEKIILYTIGCPKCKVLKMKLDKAGIKYEICEDIETMKNKNIMSAPSLEVGTEMLDFSAAIKWIAQYNVEAPHEN